MSGPGGDRDWARLLAAAKRSLERTGGSLDTTVTIAAPSDAERRIVIGVTGVHRSATAHRLAVPLGDLDTYLTEAYGLTLSTVVANGSPLRDRPAERRREAAAREHARAVAATCRHAGREWFERWLSEIGVDGTLTRIVRAGGDLGAVVRVLDALPAADVPLPVFAERVLADTKAFGDVALRGLVLRAVAAWQGSDVAASAEQERSLWESVG